MLNAPRQRRLMAGLTHLKRRAPIMGGTYALWGGLFSIFDLSLYKIRGKSDALNPIASGFLTGGALSFRGGPRVAFKNAMIGGVLLGIISGVEVGMTKH